MKTVHIIPNAHLDPVWLWSWRNGLDEVLNSSYYICSLLDRHPEMTYCRGEAWIYESIQQIDPELFNRIQEHIKAGRWEIVGGWHIQPDCNLPSGFAMERQIALGKEYFLKEFGQFPEVAYNVDSFGHAATLPGYIRAAGQSSYVMMRPQENEMTLPARVFRWRGYADGPEVTTFRIAAAYCTPEGMTEAHIHSALSELPEGVSHTMCFVGVGDHGGGPTEAIFQWCLDHQDSFPGVRLEFSTPSRFFKAIQSEADKLPLVIGELQQHAIGCFTVHRPVKVGVRKAEHRLRQAEIVGVEPSALKKAWSRVCFNHFHDTLGGTCLPSAYEDVHAELGAALATADETATMALRKRVIGQPENPAQRLVFFQASEGTFNDYIEIEPWIEWTTWQPTWGLVDESDKPLQIQTLVPETHWDNQVRLFFPLTIKSAELRTLRIVDHGTVAKDIDGAVKATATSLAGMASVSLEQGKLIFPEGEFPLPKLVLTDDASDTWSHGIDRYPRENPELAIWEETIILNKGPLMASFSQKGKIGSSEVTAEWRVYHDRPVVELQLRVSWVEKRRLLKLDVDLPNGVSEREDGIMGGSLIRPPSGRELPLRDWSLIRPAKGDVTLGVVAPDVFAIDGDQNRIGLTLLRSSVMACHEPNLGLDPRSVFSDQGEHLFKFRFAAGKSLKADELEAQADAIHRPPLNVEVTRGMKTRATRGGYNPISL